MLLNIVKQTPYIYYNFFILGNLVRKSFYFHFSYQYSSVHMHRRSLCRFSGTDISRSCSAIWGYRCDDTIMQTAIIGDKSVYQCFGTIKNERRIV